MSESFLIRPLAGEIKRLLITVPVFYFSNRLIRMRKLMSKGNGKNYYGVDSKGIIHEVVKMRGMFYRTKYVIGEGLRTIGDPLKSNEFILQE